MADTSEFRKKLRSGEYVSLTGAKRAIGKMKGWSEVDRNKARAAAERHFAGEESPPKKVAKKKTKKKAQSKPAKKAAAKKVPKKRKAKKVRRAQKAVTTTHRASPKPRGDQPVMQRIELAHATVGTYKQALDTLERCKQLAPEVDITKGVQKATDGLTQLVQGLFTDVVGTLSPNEEKAAQLLAKSQPSNGGMVAPTPPVVTPPPQQPPGATI